LSALAIASKECPETPFILVSGILGEEWSSKVSRAAALKEVCQRQGRQQAQGEGEAKFAAFAESIPASPLFSKTRSEA